MSDTAQETGSKPTSFVPNSYSTPNAFVDKLMYLLEPKEWVVLSFVCRHILGWKDKLASRTGALAITMIETGFEANGNRYMGCGLSRPTIVKAIENLLKFKIVVKVGKPSRKGQFYRIPDDDSEIDYTGLQMRIKEKFEKAQNRTKMARERKSIGKSDIPIETPAAVNATNRKRLMPLTDSGKSHLLNHNHIKPSKNHISLEPSVPGIQESEDEPKTKRKPDPIFDWVALNIFKVTPDSAHEDEDTNRWIGANSAKLVNAEKRLLGIPEKKPLSDDHRRALAVQLPGMLKFYRADNPGMSPPKAKGKFGTLVLGWYDAGKPFSATIAEVRYVPVEHDDYVSPGEAA